MNGENDDGHLQRLGINMDGLENEMRTAIAKDSRYWLENDAKIRAVEQRVPTYEHFRQLVAGCHLKSLDKAELVNQSVNKPAWSCSTGSVIDSNLIEKPLDREKFDVHKTFETAPELLSCWRSNYSAKQLDEQTKFIKLFQMLTSQSSAILNDLFDSGLGMVMLPEILQVFDQVLTNKTNVNESKSLIDFCIPILMTLSNFAQSDQFCLAGLCLSDQEQQTAQHLLDHIDSILGQTDHSNNEHYTMCITKIRSGLGLL